MAKKRKIKNLSYPQEEKILKELNPSLQSCESCKRRTDIKIFQRFLLSIRNKLDEVSYDAVSMDQLLCEQCFVDCINIFSLQYYYQTKNDNKNDLIIKFLLEYEIFKEQQLQDDETKTVF